MCPKSHHLSGFHGRLAVAPRGGVRSPVLGLRAQAKATEPVSIRPVSQARKNLCGPGSHQKVGYERNDRE